MKSMIVKRSVVVASHKTSVSLEDQFWKGLKEIAGARESSLSGLVDAINTERCHGNLSSAIRLFVLDHFRLQARGGGGQLTRQDMPAARATPAL